jgi:hypothetical protein
MEVIDGSHETVLEFLLGCADGIAKSAAESGGPRVRLNAACDGRLLQGSPAQVTVSAL